MIPSDQFYFLYADASSPYTLNMYKITFGQTSSDWANKMACNSGTWTTGLSESLLSTSGSLIYSYFIYGDSVKYMYLVSFVASTGSVFGSRYRSSAVWTTIYGIAQIGNYVTTIATCSDTYLVAFNVETSKFLLRLFNGDYLRSCIEEP